MSVIFKLILTFFRSLKAGEELSSSAGIKKAQVLANGSAGIVAGAVTIAKAAGVDIPIDEETVTAVANGVVSILAAFNVGATVSTSKKIGF